MITLITNRYDHIFANRWKLLGKSNIPLQVGDELSTTRHGAVARDQSHSWVIVGFCPPHREGSSGKVHVYRSDNPSVSSTFYVTAFGCHYEFR